MRSFRNRLLGLGICATLAAAACSDTTGTPDGPVYLTVALTDAADTLLASAVVHIGEVQLIPADGAPLTVTDDGGTHDLLTLQNGVTASLGTLEIEPGTYLQLRLIVDSAVVTLRDGLTFRNGSQTQSLAVPSGAQTGIKINLDASDGDPSTPGVTMVPGETILIVDFDVSQNFVVQGNPSTPAGIQGFRFTPLLRATVRSVEGSISGTVVDSTDAAFVGASVRAMQVDAGVMEALQTPLATAVTADDGTYRIMFLAPGVYEVGVDSVATIPAADTVAVGAGEDIAGVDFTQDGS